MPIINISLNGGSIDAATRKLKAYAKKVEDAPEKVVKELTEQGAEQAKDFAMYMNAYDTGELVNGIVAEASGSEGRIVATAPHSAYVEFGTGVVGEMSPAPHAGQNGWNYDVNEHGEAGWYYIGEDGKRHWTKGMPSRPFMYDTAKVMREAVPDKVKEALK